MQEAGRFLPAAAAFDGVVGGAAARALFFEGGGLALGLGTGTFNLVAAGSCPGDPAKPCDAGSALANFNLDGTLDTVIAPYDASTSSYQSVLRIGTAAGFGDPQSLKITPGARNSIISGDWNLDGAPDLAVASGQSVRIYLNLTPTVLTSAVWTPWSRSEAATKMVTPGSLATAKGVNYSTQAASAPGIPYPLKLGGVQVRLNDPAGGHNFAPLLYVSPSQINFQVPSNTALGWSAVDLVTSDSTRFIGWVEVKETAPTIFYVVTGSKVNPDGSTTPTQFDFDAHWPVPAIVTFYGTGFRGATPENTRLLLGSSSIKPLSVGPHPSLPGIDALVFRIDAGDVDYEDDVYGSGVIIQTKGLRSNFMYTGFW